MGTEYRKEFFDRSYTFRENYARAWKYLRRYKLRIFLGIFCGMLTAGTLLPIYQIVQPVTAKVSESEAVRAQPQPAATDAARPKTKFERRLARAAELPAWYGPLAKAAKACGLDLEGENGEMGGALLVIVLFGLPLVAAFRLGVMFLNQYCLAWVGSRVINDLREDLLRHVQRQSLQFHGRVDVGQIMVRATGDPAVMQEIVQSVMVELARAPFEILISIGFILWFAISHHMLATLALIAVGLPAFVVPIAQIGRKIRKWSRRQLEEGSVVGSRLHEVLTCVRVVKAYDCEEFENEKYAEVNDSLLKVTLRALRAGLIVRPTVETVGILLVCFFLVWCFFTHVTLANFLPMVAPLLLIYKPIKELTGLQVQLEVAQVSLQRMWSLLDVDMALPEQADAAPKKSFDDKVVFEDVSFRYDTADRDAVSHVSFEIGRGKTVAVVGTTGSGKSTLSALLARFYDPQGGRVTMDGRDLRDLRVDDLRALVGSVQQETILFNDTIEANIAYGSPRATHEEVVAAAKLAKAHSFIVAQPEGYARVVGEKGFALSGGERQRIAIARAILRNPPILVLDEATSALDTVTEHLVQEALENLMRDRTVFAIAHRLSTIRHADLILVMREGRVVERGTHDELYALGGVYRGLCDMQRLPIFNTTMPK